MDWRVSIENPFASIGSEAQTRKAQPRGAISLTLTALAATFLWYPPTLARAQTRPAYCDQTAPQLLGNLQTPYTVRNRAGGKRYCEGLLVRPIALPPPKVISVKQIQPVQKFVARSLVSLTWCGDPVFPVHISLRSTKIPFFGLDALEAKSFSWPSDVIAAWQPAWDNLAALGSRSIKVSGRSYLALIPLRVGEGYANSYVFLLRAGSRPAISKVLIRGIGVNEQLRIAAAALSAGPTSDTWKVNVSFKGVSEGVYSVSFSESAEDAGIASTTVNLLHKSCESRA